MCRIASAEHQEMILSWVWCYTNLIDNVFIIKIKNCLQ